MSNKILDDANGNKSSKRIAGFVGMGAALALTIVAVVMNSSADVTGMLYAWLGFASACLIGGVFEKKA